MDKMSQDQGTASARGELLDRIHRRATRLRVRRTLATRVAPVALVALIALPVAAGLASGGKPGTVVSTDDAGPPPADRSGEPAETTTSTTANGEGDPNSSGATPTTTAETTTTTRRATETTQAPATTTSTTAATDSACPMSAFELRTTTDRAAYSVGQEVVVTGTVTNRSSKDCVPPRWRGAFVKDAQDRVVHSYDRPSGVGAPGGDPPVLQPGHSLDVTWRWDQVACSSSCSPIPPGSYSVALIWGSTFTQAQSPRFSIGAS